MQNLGEAENIVYDGDVDRDENDQIDRASKDSVDESAEGVVPNPKAVRVGPGRPKLIHTGKPGRPKKQYNLHGAMVARGVRRDNKLRVCLSMA